MDIIQAINLTKKFGNFVANDNINLSIKENEIKAIVGENGAGKSTLMNMLYGLLKPTSGEILIRGLVVHFDSPIDAIEHGIGMVHQHFKLVPTLTIFENVLLGIEIHKTCRFLKWKWKLPIIDHKYEKKRVQELINQYGFNLKADDYVKDLSIGAKQKVEILKMLYRQVKIIIFDEPTAVLTPQEIDMFFDTLRELKKNGATVILITHKLQEVIAVSDSVTVIKQGKVVGELITSQTNSSDIAKLMVGREVLLNVAKNYADYRDKPVIYQVDQIATNNHEGREILHHVSFSVHEGEIVGIAGVEGNGQSELLNVLTGIMRSTSGKVFYKGNEITNVNATRVRKSHIAIIPEDRYEQGLCLEMRIADNLIAGYHHLPDICRYGFLKAKAMKNKTFDLVEKYDIRVSNIDGHISSLSGGNAQKVIIAREFSSNPDILIAAQPTRGVDIGAIEFIHQQLIDLQKAGKAIILISSELSEIMTLSDRILVMFKGQIVGEVLGENANRENIGLLMMGVKNG